MWKYPGSQMGAKIALSIDSKIQYLAFRELKQAVETHKAKAGGIVVLDAQTGELLALVNLPAYNPNNRARTNGGRARNRALTDVFEPGSTLKPFTIAAALEAGGVKPDTVFETAPGTFSIGKATIRDAHKEGPLTVARDQKPVTSAPQDCFVAAAWRCGDAERFRVCAHRFRISRSRRAAPPAAPGVPSNRPPCPMDTESQ
jgi:cell division protein FtsI/penicillin-binding protein 2